MKLDAYIRKIGTTEQALAALVGCSQGTINKLRNGKANPTLELLESLMAATNGAVTPNDFIMPFRPEETGGTISVAEVGCEAAADDAVAAPAKPAASSPETLTEAAK